MDITLARRRTGAASARLQHTTHAHAYAQTIDTYVVTLQLVGACACACVAGAAVGWHRFTSRLRAARIEFKMQMSWCVCEWTTEKMGAASEHYQSALSTRQSGRSVRPNASGVRVHLHKWNYI